MRRLLFTVGKVPQASGPKPAPKNQTTVSMLDLRAHRESVELVSGVNPRFALVGAGSGKRLAVWPAPAAVFASSTPGLELVRNGKPTAATVIPAQSLAV